MGNWRNLCFISGSVTDLINTRSGFFTPPGPPYCVFVHKLLGKEAFFLWQFSVLRISLRGEFLGTLTSNANNLIILIHFKQRLIVPL